MSYYKEVGCACKQNKFYYCEKEVPNLFYRAKIVNIKNKKQVIVRLNKHGAIHELLTDINSVYIMSKKSILTISFHFNYVQSIFNKYHKT